MNCRKGVTERMNKRTNEKCVGYGDVKRGRMNERICFSGFLSLLFVLSSSFLLQGRMNECADERCTAYAYVQRSRMSE